MRRLLALLAATGALSVAACDNPNESSDVETADTIYDEAVAPAAAEVAVPAAAPSVVAAPPADSTTLPPEKRSSEESVKPDSETLFY